MDTHIPHVPTDQRSPISYGVAAVANYLMECAFDVECTTTVNPPHSECILIATPLDPGGIVVVVPFRNPNLYEASADALCGIVNLSSHDALFEDMAKRLQAREGAGRMISLAHLRAQMPYLDMYCRELEAAGKTAR